MRNRQPDAITLEGRGLSPGIAVGTAYRAMPRIGAAYYRIHIESSEIDEELRRLQAAVDRSRRQLDEVRRRLEERVGSEQSCIVDAHRMILEDRNFLQEIEGRVRSLHGAERAVRETAEHWLKLYRSLKDPFFRERGSDLEDVSERLVANLGVLKPLKKQDLPDDLILVSERMSLLTLADYGLERIKGLVLSTAGHASHLLIVARSCRIPVVAGIRNVVESVGSGDVLAIDGSRGVVHLRPGATQLNLYAETMREEARLSRQLAGDTDPCLTEDGQRIRILANTEVGSEVELGLRMGGEGIGLFRSEAIYLECREGPVDEESQYAVYSALARAVGPHTAIVRTLDVGDEDHPYFSRLAGGPAPILGLRGIRLSLRHPETFRSQIRAVLRARHEGNLKIALPMVSTLEEVRRSRSLIEQIQKELGAAPEAYGPVETGIMVEVPAAVLTLEALLTGSDFVLVGSNDLIQFTLAVGRTEERVSELYDAYHPAVLRSLSRIAQTCRRLGKTAIVCGEVAADPEYVPLLAGMGFQVLSMSPFAIPAVKRRLRETNAQASARAFEDLLLLATAEEIRRRWLKTESAAQKTVAGEVTAREF